MEQWTSAASVEWMPFLMKLCKILDFYPFNPQRSNKSTIQPIYTISMTLLQVLKIIFPSSVNFKVTIFIALYYKGEMKVGLYKFFSRIPELCTKTTMSLCTFLYCICLKSCLVIELNLNRINFDTTIWQRRHVAQ
jgi:hypothetical protein